MRTATSTPLKFCKKKTKETPKPPPKPKYTDFYTEIFSWGLDSHGQLGLGLQENHFSADNDH